MDVELSLVVLTFLFNLHDDDAE